MPYLDNIPRRFVQTLLALVIVRIGAQIPLPGVVAPAEPAGGGLIALLGSSATRFSVMALGMAPILSTRLLLEATRLVFPAVVRWEDRAPGRAALLRQWAFALALAYTAVWALRLAIALEGVRALVDEPGWEFRLSVVASLIGATAFLGWLADRITREGVCDGFWLLVAAPIVDALPGSAALMADAARTGALEPRTLGLVAAAAIAAVAAVVAARRAWLGPAAGQGRSTLAFLWPPVIAGYGLGYGLFLYALATTLAGAADENASYLVDFRARWLIWAALIVFFNFRLSRSPARPPGGSVWPLALAQLVVVIGGELAMFVAGLPLYIGGVSFVLVVAVAGDVVEGLGLAPRCG
jgi:preprotein translocase subunit SecY